MQQLITRHYGNEPTTSHYRRILKMRKMKLIPEVFPSREKLLGHKLLLGRAAAAEKI